MLRILVGFLSTVALRIDDIPSIVPMVADSLAALFFLAGGIAWTMVRKRERCIYMHQTIEKVLKVDIILPALHSLCRRALVNEIFNFIGFAASVALVGYTFLSYKRKGSTPPYVA